ncbi:MAG TPA: ATP-binding protein, partial [Salinisphaeraceae bacterium]|nr:ATP-binding protein [Salinisphaeraceae bacterium]
ASALTRMLHAGKPAEETTPIVRKMADQVERAGDIIGTVRDFVGRRSNGYDAVDLNRLLQGAIALTTGQARKAGVDMHFSEHSPLPEIHGEAVQLQQIVINLINNAMEAMQDNKRGQRTLWLRTELPDEAHAQVVVEDNGPGIAPGKLEAVFDSFHTTKLEGMGMGLAICRSIAEWHGGQLWAESELGHGARFCLRLPVQQEDA